MSAAGEEVSGSVESSRSTKASSNRRTVLNVGEMGESFPASTIVEDPSNPDFENSAILRPIKSEKIEQLSLHEQNSDDYSKTEIRTDFGATTWQDDASQVTSSEQSRLQQPYPGYQQKYFNQQYSLSPVAPGQRTTSRQTSYSDVNSIISVGSNVRPVAWNDGAPTVVSGPRLTPVKARQLSQADLSERKDLDSFLPDPNRSHLGSAMYEPPTATVVPVSVFGDETSANDTTPTMYKKDIKPDINEQSWSHGGGAGGNMSVNSTHDTTAKNEREQVLPQMDGTTESRTIQPTVVVDPSTANKHSSSTEDKHQSLLKETATRETANKDGDDNASQYSSSSKMGRLRVTRFVRLVNYKRKSRRSSVNEKQPKEKEKVKEVRGTISLDGDSTLR